MVFAVVVSSSHIVDVIPHYNHYVHKYGDGVSASYFHKAQGHAYYGHGYGKGYGYVYAPVKYVYAPHGYGYGLGYKGMGHGYGFGYSGHFYGKW